MLKIREEKVCPKLQGPRVNIAARTLMIRMSPNFRHNGTFVKAKQPVRFF